MRAFEYRHLVGFEETNLVGNVYYANHVRWQGRCRELFLREHVPEVLRQLDEGLVLVTTRVSCDYFQELSAFDEVILRMTAGPVTQSRITMCFDYFRAGPDGREELVARGEQQIACLRRENGRMVPERMPEALSSALAGYRR